MKFLDRRPSVCARVDKLGDDEFCSAADCPAPLSGFR
jgi:hypothetical protein